MSECPYCTNAFEVNDTCHDEFRMWQGLVGPYYIPTIEDGVLTWTNTGGLPNPNPINIIGAQGNGLYIGGIAETTGDLPETAENGVTWLVGSDEPYEGYVYLNGSWVDIGAVTPGPTGPQGIPGAGVPSGGTTGQVLQKASNTDYQTEWADPASGGDPPGTMLPLMDGTAAVGTARSYAREDHVHPQDSDIAELKTSLNNLVTGVSSVNTQTGDVVLDAADVGAMAEWDLLWENASPTSNFAAQTIQFDYTEFTHLLVIVKNRVDQGECTSVICRVTDGGVSYSKNTLLTSEAKAYFQFRSGKIVSNGIQFNDALECDTSAPRGVASNAVLIPLAVYGIKGAIS